MEVFPNSRPPLNDSPHLPEPDTKRKRGPSFWLIILAICTTLFLSALELTAVSNALPIITSSLQGNDFIWVGSAYSLASTAVLPLSGGLAQVFGRRPAMISSIIFYAIGSALCGASPTMNILIAGRTIQGIGGGGVQSLSSIILADLVPLSERGTYVGLFGLTWSIASIIGPVVGGKLASDGQWRWIFYLNLPFCGVAFFLVLGLLKLPIPPGTMPEKLSRMDWLGNFLVISSSCSCIIALTWGGITHPWDSASTLVPLILGLLLLAVFFVLEARWANYPIVPFSLLSNRTSFSGYLQTFFLPVTSLALIYYLPVYFQACKDASPIRSGLLGLGLATTAPSAIVAGVFVRKAKRYRPPIWGGWCLMVMATGLLSTLSASSSSGIAVLFCVLYGIGAGMNYATQTFPVLAPLPITTNAHALALLIFVRTFAGVWGVTLGGAILQNELHRRLPEDFISQFPSGVATAYAAIPEIKNLPQPLKGEVQRAFAESIQLIWKVLAGVSGAGLLSSLLMSGLPLATDTDVKWAMVEPKPATEHA